MSWRATVLTLFPEMFPGPLGHSLAGRALEGGIWSLDARDLRAHGLGRLRASTEPVPLRDGGRSLGRCGGGTKPIG